MKIEKINDNQIRCTLTRADLASRQLKLSELAYGTEKAKSLFHDMMRQASREFGFEAEDIPLMIEAIPSSSGSIVLIITKVEDPEELDTRFSKFAPLGESDGRKGASLDKLEGAEEFLDLLTKVKESVTTDESTTSEAIPEELRVRLFSFANLDSVINATQLLSKLYEGLNTLYKDKLNDYYILALTQDQYSSMDFNRICNMLSEYGSLERASGVSLAYLEEHCHAIISSNAVQQLSTL